MADDRLGTTEAHDTLTQLVYELLDAHDDTARLAVELTADDRWGAHLAYLRDLQRVGRELLAGLEDRGHRPVQEPGPLARLRWTVRHASAQRTSM